MKNCKVLIVDDDPRQIKIYYNLFKKKNKLNSLNFEAFFSRRLAKMEAVELGSTLEDIHLYEATQGEEAVDIVRQLKSKQESISIAFIDMRMPPGINGLETALKIRALDPCVYIVIVTAFSHIDLKEVSRQINENVLCLRKPFQTEEIEQITINFISSWQKDISIKAYQEALSLKIKSNHIEAQTHQLMRPIFRSFADVANAQSGLIQELNTICQNKTRGANDKVNQISATVLKDAKEMSDKIVLMQQLIHPSSDAMMFRMKDLIEWIKMLTPELRHPMNSLKVEFINEVDETQQLSLPVNQLVIAITKMIKVFLELIVRNKEQDSINLLICFSQENKHVMFILKEDSLSANTVLMKKIFESSSPDAVEMHQAIALMDSFCVLAKGSYTRRFNELAPSELFKLSFPAYQC